MENYHKHSCVSNIILPDSPVFNEDYCKRAVELGQHIISSCEHGTQGRYRECADLAQKYGLKWRYVSEAYYVKDRHEKDKTNCHIILAAKTEKGIGDINEALSDAHEDGYYYRPRVDTEILMRLSPEDVFVTTACVGGIWAYGAVYEDKEVITEEGRTKLKKTLVGYDFTEPDSIVRMLKSHFKDSFMLEVQYHDTKTQKMINKHIVDISKRMNIQMIAGLDSHYIYPEDKTLRDILLESKKLFYEDEEGWYMDYPDEDTVYNRFIEQGVLSEEDIRKAIDNTNIFLSFEDITFDKSKKLPTIYPMLSQEERNEKYRQLIRDKWTEYKKTVPADKWEEYEAGIKYEVDTITNTNTSDYFLLDYEIVKKYKEMGGRLTYTGRGSAPSYFTNSLLGFSSIDRFALPVTMYPDRFISENRLKAGSMPD